MFWTDPRSTWIHCGSTPCVLSHRVVMLPSKAKLGELTAEDAVAARPAAMLFAVMHPVGAAVGEVPPLDTPLPMKSIQLSRKRSVPVPLKTKYTLCVPVDEARLAFTSM